MTKAPHIAPEWILTAHHRPDPGVEVDACDSGGHVQRLVFKDGLWWFPDFSMYVYFTPTAWRSVDEIEAGR